MQVDQHHHDHGSMRLGGLYLWAGIAVGLLIILALYASKAGWFGGKEPSPPVAALEHRGDKIAIPAESPIRPRLAVAPAATRSTGARLVLPGMIEADPARTVAVLPPLAGRLAELNVSLGDRVAAGQVLAVIDSPDLAQAYEDDEKAADALALAEKTLKRQSQSQEIGVASDHDLDQAKSDRAQAEAEHVRTQARLKDLGAQTADHRRLVIRAAAAGSVTALNAAQGAMLNDPTQALMTLADLSTVWVTALVPERSLGQVAKGQPAEVALDAYPGRSWSGQVAFVADMVEPDSRRDKVRIAFANPDLALKPNMFATVTLKGAETAQVVVPTSALLMNNDSTSVFVETGDWVFERRPVTLSLEEGTEVALAAGVKPGEKVVVKGGILLND